jgi:hypothetical protein
LLIADLINLSLIVIVTCIVLPLLLCVYYTIKPIPLSTEGSLVTSVD